MFFDSHETLYATCQIQQTTVSETSVSELTRLSRQDYISRVCRASFLELRCLLSVCSTVSLKKHVCETCQFGKVPSWLQQLSVGRSACSTDRSIAEGSEQCSTACSEEM